MRSRILIVALSCLLFGSQVSARAALVFAINGQEGTVPAFNLGAGNPSTTFTVQVRRDDFNSGGSHLSSFAFRVRSSNASIAQFTAANLSSPGNLTSTTAVASGATATAAGTYTNRPQVYFEFPGTYVSLASFTLTALNPGSTAITIEEFSVDALSAGPVDFMLGTPLGPTVGQDRSGFSGDGSFIGTASTSVIAISVVPEPSTLILAASGTVLGCLVRRRRRG